MDLELTHQEIEAFDRRLGLMIGQMRVTRGGEDGLMTEELLQVREIDAGFYAVCGETVAQTMGRNSFFKPHCTHTARKAFCTPPSSK